MTTFQTTRAADELFLKGQMVLSEMNSNGIRVDKTHLDHTIKSVQTKIAALEDGLKRHEVYREWKKAYGDKLAFTNRDQLADVLFNKMGMKAEGQTTRRQSTAKKDLEKLDDPFVKEFLRLEPLKNSLRTNLVGLRREIVEYDGCWWVHPQTHLNTTKTARSSSSMPNWQNYPKRNPEVAQMVRPCFIPRPGWHFVDKDYGQIEVRVPACLTGDKELNRYIHDPQSDMHRDQAMACFLLDEDEVSKPIRQTVKTYFVFATFYGAPHYNTAKWLWDDLERMELKTASGVDLREHLRRKGIDRLGDCDANFPLVEGTFVHHVKKCNEKLWERFKGYGDWKRRQVDSYRRSGGMMTVTGFAVVGPRTATQIANYGIQGPAFHCTLWSLIEMSRDIARYKMDAKLLGEIHDSIQTDVPPAELDDFLSMSKEIMTERIRKAWDWITVPLTVEMEVSPRDGTWYSCSEWVERKPGRWDLKAKKAA